MPAISLNEWRPCPQGYLEIAAGTGVVTRALAPLLSPGSSYVVTVLNPPMLDYAASRQAPDNRIVWRQADALRLPIGDAAFDVVNSPRELDRSSSVRDPEGRREIAGLPRECFVDLHRELLLVVRLVQSRNV
jgi:SAM-dependent methyltransferase